MSQLYLKPIVLAGFSAVLLMGCTTPLTSSNFSRSEARIIQEVDYGLVVGARSVIIDGTSTGQGSGTGTIVGGLGGSTIGTGNMNILATAGGALFGSVAGGGLEERVTRASGVELIIKLDSTGKKIAFVQEVSVPPLLVGQRIRMTSGGGGVTRVIADDSTPNPTASDVIDAPVIKMAM